MLLKRLTSGNQQPVSFTLGIQVEKKKPVSTSKFALSASNPFAQELFQILLERYPVMISFPEVNFQYEQQFDRV